MGFQTSQVEIQSEGTGTVVRQCSVPPAAKSSAVGLCLDVSSLPGRVFGLPGQ